MVLAISFSLAIKRALFNIAFEYSGILIAFDLQLTRSDFGEASVI